MGREHHTSEDRNGPSPEKRYQDFAKENAAWDRRVKDSIEKIGRASKARERAERSTSGS
ncbi:MAG: hypothetical protein M3340_16630 [Actinomycetota bacterium]|nr:hypothetical protein [Actinomycetota bacterium]